ncbi:hypothetical protein IscW_ISCW015752 [Ixodes scapularis]|uniref:Uncharacterized protein n=1 Tax=Ixodes scapularis TaxID=6945 RepID=B7P279_IXOSC|nr:hypothetical protein IscW_ISCW015752 [Ixodes scapularis]|eukprot:XP_002401796.1 hypothetical protein IscW_ISCW015752 [Ixodes scapularis]
MARCRLRLKRVSKSMLRRAAMYFKSSAALNLHTKHALECGTFGSILLGFISRVHPTAGYVSHNVVICTFPAYCDTIVHIHQIFKQDVTQDREGPNPRFRWKPAPYQQHPHRPQCSVQTRHLWAR